MRKRRSITAELELPRGSKFMVKPQERRVWVELLDFVDNHVPVSQAIFVGLHRHDVIVIGDVMIYFLLNRPIATRYHELHPAVADTEKVQKEIVRDLKRHKVSVIILRRFFSDKVFESVKEGFMRNLPQIGVTILDEFLRNNYSQTRTFGPYTVWARKNNLTNQRIKPD